MASSPSAYSAVSAAAGAAIETVAGLSVYVQKLADAVLGERRGGMAWW